MRVDLSRPAAAGGACVGDDSVDSSKGVLGGIERGRCSSIISHVERYCQRFAATGAQFSRQLFGQISPPST